MLTRLSTISTQSCRSRDALPAEYLNRSNVERGTGRVFLAICAYLRISGGGEPMLHPQATELLVYAKKVGCKIGLITNGSLFDETNSRALLEAGVDMIEFSVDACDPVTYGVVRKGLEWDLLVENARRMLSMRNERRSSCKAVASAVLQTRIDIDSV